MYQIEIKIGDYIITRYISDLKILDELVKDKRYEVIKIEKVKDKGKSRYILMGGDKDE